ncbi:MAG: hypothetical protein KAY37_04480 [Phycisphaerae bacterium]|nr:hypothetical protein [Phycisphaerae bacterium]
MAWDVTKVLKPVDAPPLETLAGGEPAATATIPAPPATGVEDQNTTGKPTLVFHPAGVTSKSAAHVGGKHRLPNLLYGGEFDCAFCKATGLVHGNVCAVCRGKGTVKVKPPLVKCAYCHGRAHVPTGSDITCPVCRGVGLNRVKPPIERCPDCRGRGRQPGQALYCGLCRGSGVITKVPEKPQEGPNVVKQRDPNKKLLPGGKEPGTGKPFQPPWHGPSVAPEEEHEMVEKKRKQALEWKPVPRAIRRPHK